MEGAPLEEGFTSIGFIVGMGLDTLDGGGMDGQGLQGIGRVQITGCCITMLLGQEALEGLDKPYVIKY